MFEVTLREEPKWQRESSFSTFLWHVLSRRFVDYMRRNIADTRYASQRNVVVTPTDDYSVFDRPVYDDAEDVPSEAHLLDGIDIDQLSDDAMRTLLDIAIPLRRGVSSESLCLSHGITPRAMRSRLAALSAELDALDMELADAA